jgi:hypothetical protein
MWVGGVVSGAALAVAAGGVPVSEAAVSLQGRPGRHEDAGGGRVVCGGVVGVAALAMAASTSGRH